MLTRRMPPWLSATLAPMRQYWLQTDTCADSLFHLFLPLWPCLQGMPGLNAGDLGGMSLGNRGVADRGDTNGDGLANAQLQALLAGAGGGGIGGSGGGRSGGYGGGRAGF